MNKKVVVVVLAASMVLSGCSVSDKRGRLARVQPLFATQTGDPLDKCFDDPRVLIAVTSPADPASGEGTISDACRPLVMQLRGYQLHSFAGAGKDEKAAWQRNEVIDALIAVSNNKCGEYAAHLKTFDGQTNSSLSIASILLGGAGGIATGADAARILSGSSAIISGSRVALNDSWFSSQTVHVLVAAFEKARDRQRRDIKNRQACPIKSYPLMSGFGDAMKYHGSCSLLTGLAQTALAVERSDQPGLDTMRRQIADLASIREQADRLVNASFANESSTTRFRRTEYEKAQSNVERAQGLADEAEKNLETARQAFRDAALGNDSLGDDVIDADVSVKSVKAIYKRAAKRVTDLEKLRDPAKAAWEAAVGRDDAAAVARRNGAVDLAQPQGDIAQCPYEPAKAPSRK